METEFHEYCRLNMHQAVTTFVSSQTEHDAEYRRMVDYIGKSGGEFLVVIPDAKHLGLDLEGVARSIVELGERGAGVVCYDDEFPNPFQNAFQTLGIKGVSSTRSRRVKESMRARALQGRALGRPAYGYHIGPDGTLEPVSEEAKVVELVFRLYTKDGLGLRLIAQHLNEREIKTRRGGRWTVVSLRDMLKNPTYTGTYTRFDMRAPRAHEAIIPHDVFRAAQDQTRARRPVGRVVNAEPFLLSGLLDCGYCGNKMMGVTRRQAWKKKDGRRSSQVYRYYQCQSRNNQSLCGYHTWRANLLENTVVAQLKYEMLAKAQSDGQKSSQGRVEQARHRAEEAVQNAERRFLRGMRRAARGEIGSQAVGGYLRQLDSAREAAEEERSPDGMGSSLDRWDEMDLDARQRFLASHVSRIVVEDDSVSVSV